MADTKDDLAARRWFRQRLADLAQQHPALHDADHQQRLSDHLAREEQTPCPENPPADPEDVP